ncbi:sulfatase-like hydrolase/transferase, partial [Salmonella enterica]|uniref:sulfatase-like hydrolase/transferase n=1 Tax=Salmonella enterica TaxID=28901 RepID=UPI000AFDAB1A
TKEWVKFSEYYAPPPLCAPSRTGMLTGSRTFRAGVRYRIPEGNNVTNGRSKLTIANLLKQQDYDSEKMGNLHLNAGGDRAVET